LAKIRVTTVQEGDTKEFEVRIEDGGSMTNHKVTLQDALYQKLTAGKTQPEAFVKAAFVFLLERESKESIMGRFDVSVISRYFPEFEKKISNYF